MDNKRAAVIMRETDYGYIAEVLNNTWEHTPEEDMLFVLTQGTGYSRETLESFVKLWYDNCDIRMRMDLADHVEWIKFIEEHLISQR